MFGEDGSAKSLLVDERMTVSQVTYYFLHTKMCSLFYIKKSFDKYGMKFEKFTLSQVCRMLADKNHVKRDTCWGLVELLPELHMERAYEDHELLVENLLMWKVITISF